MQSEQDRLLDKEGNVVEGLPLSYDNIDEQGHVLYLDEDRLRRKEQPDKKLFVNHRRGIGFKNLWVTHVSARAWNWNVILAVFRKLVAWSAYMKHPETMRSRLYKHGMLFEPQDKTYSTGSIYNLHVDTADAFPDAQPVPTAAERAEQADKPPAAEGAHDDGCADHADHVGAPMQPFECKSEHSAVIGKGTAKSIPVGKQVAKETGSVVVPYDLVRKAIMEAKYIGGMKECLCRAGQNCQNYPHDLACLFLNMGGKVIVEHGMATELTKEEALARVDRAADLGLECQSLWVEIEQLIWGFRNDQMDSFLEICFCCPCCCVGFNLSKNATRDVKRRFSPTGWTAVVDHDRCIGCGKCASTYCPQDAVHFRESDGKMVVDQEDCVGCGFCKRNCPEGAITIKQTMPMRKSMHEYFLEEGRLAIRPGKEFEDAPVTD